MKNYSVKNLISTAILSSLWLPAIVVNAEENSHEHLHDHGADPMVTKVMFDQIEFRNADGKNPSFIEAQAWIGKDLNKFWLKTDIEKRDGKIDDTELQALYSRAIAPFWDVQVGIRKDIKPTPARTWGVIGVQGIAPYFFDIDAVFFIGESGRTAARFSAEYDLLFTQRLILSPNLEVNLYGKHDWETGTGSGLSDANAGLRLRYEIRREFAPYIGLHWRKKFGSTADFAKFHEENSSNTEWVLGLRAWF